MERGQYGDNFVLYGDVGQEEGGKCADLWVNWPWRWVEPGFRPVPNSPLRWPSLVAHLNSPMWSAPGLLGLAN